MSALSAALLVSCIAFSTSMAQTAATLLQVKRLYVGSLGQKQGATEIRDKIVKRLRRGSEVEIVASPNEADAVITGDGEIWVKGYINPSSRAHDARPVFGGYLSVELKGRNNETLWS
jgi:hypothetical protein